MLKKGTIMSGTSPKQLEADKAGDACRRNAQRSTGPRTRYPTALLWVGAPAISDCGSLTIELKPFGVPEASPVEKESVANCRRSYNLPASCDTFRTLRYQNAIERQLHRAITQLYRLQEHRGLSNPQPLETPPIDEN
jgi:hypothetical protein